MITTVAGNILANVAGGGGMAVLLVVVPLYLRLLGAEAYGLVGLFTTVMVASTALDLGLGTTFNREIARITAGARSDGAGRDLTTTLEAGGWCVGLVVGMLFATAVPAVAGRWLNVASLSPDEVRGALWLMAAAVPALIARGVYLAGLNGLQRQTLVNVLQIGGITLRAGASVATLTLLAPTVTVFFVTQTVLLYVETLAVAVALRRALPSSVRGGRVRPAALRPVMGFSAGVGGTMLLGFGLTSLDQVVLSGILPLADFGAYTLAVAASNVVGYLVQPVTTAVYPRLSQLVERGDTRTLAREYHFFSQLVAVLVLPLGALLVFFPSEFLLLWTREESLGHAVAGVLALRAVGTVLNSLMYVPHLLQLAFGWSSLGATVNAIALVIVAPATVLSSRQWGGAGAAAVYVCLNVAALVLVMVRMHRRVLAGELTRWYWRLLRPSAAVLVIAALSRSAMPDALGGAAQLIWLVTTGGLATGAALATAGSVRRRVLATAQRVG
jgi:O-antigen/teichoic acid export membrane protein